MANMNNTKADFGIAVGITNQWQNSNMAAGAGANANSKVDLMTFVGSDTLAELVWSPETGLSIKFVDKKPCFMWEVGPSDTSGPQNQKETEQLSDQLFEDGMTSGVDGVGSDIKSLLKTEAMMQCGPQEHLKKAIVKIEKDGHFNDPLCENAQDAILEYKKSFYSQENDEKHEVESHGSMESCKHAKRKRILSFDQQLLLGSKRIKKQNDGSFMNWISNMLKDFKSHKNQSFCDINRSFESRKMGFESVFRSLCLPDVKAHETMTQTDKCSHGSLDFLKIKEKEAKGVVKHIRLYKRVTKEALKGIFDTIRRLRLSRTDILKWTNSRLSFVHLDGFFVRLRVAKWEEGEGGSRYYVACIRGLQGENSENSSGGLKQLICVKVGGVECFIESQYVSNGDFLEDELIAWWQKTSRNGGTPFVKDLTSKLAKRKTLGL
ncbi:hypothetical protein L2E82_45410 [Cichorium intybus]|uniref:Uncharacterized protein n=1 Tax=Cichorium intybus TaxID=13427 RepID=A0ACB8ZSH8_CICIN|nr:hypothetical protein L2E82_45410 [Cichorium intybus]